MTTTNRKAYSYLRFSTPEQSLGDSERRQIELARGYALAHGLELDETVTADRGISAFHGKNMAEGALGLFLERIAAGEIAPGSYLLVESVDRLSRRSPWDAIDTLKRIIDQGVTLVTLNDSRQYTREGMRSDLSALFYLTAIMARAHEESSTKSKRISASWSQRRKVAQETGKRVTSVCPAWMKPRVDGHGFDLIPDRAKIVRKVFEKYIAGMGTGGIAKWLNTSGIEPWSKARLWSHSYIKRMVENPACIGTFQPHHDVTEGEETTRKPCGDPVLGYYPAAVSEELFQNVQAMRQGRTTNRTTHANHNVFAGGLAKCPLCGGAMTIENKSKRHSQSEVPSRYLLCRAAASSRGVLCVSKRARYETVEAALIKALPEVVANAPLGAGTAEWEEEVAGHEAVQGELQDRIERLVRGVRTAGGSQALIDDLKATERDLEASRTEVRELEARIAAASPKAVLKRLGKLAEAAEANDPAAVNAALRATVREVTINYPAGELVITWSHVDQSVAVPYRYDWPKE